MMVRMAERTTWRQRRAQRRGLVLTPPKTIREMFVRYLLLRARVKWTNVGLVFLIVALPFVTWLAVSIGERGREANCRTIEHALIHHDRHITDGLIAAFTRSEDPAEAAQTRAAGERFNDGLDAGVRMDLATCNG